MTSLATKRRRSNNRPRCVCCEYFTESSVDGNIGKSLKRNGRANVDFSCRICRLMPDAWPARLLSAYRRSSTSLHVNNFQNLRLTNDHGFLNQELA